MNSEILVKCPNHNKMLRYGVEFGASRLLQRLKYQNSIENFKWQMKKNQS